MPNKKEQNAAVNPRGAAGAGAAAGGDAYDAGSIRVLEGLEAVRTRPCFHKGTESPDL